jgi:hypothetical protein
MRRGSERRDGVAFGDSEMTEPVIPTIWMDCGCRERSLWIDDSGERRVLYLNQLERILSRISIFSDHDRDGLTDIDDFGMRQHALSRALQFMPYRFLPLDVVVDEGIREW